MCVPHICVCGNVAVSPGSLTSHAVALNEQALSLHSALTFVHLPVYKWLKVTGPDVTDRFRHTSIAPVSVWRGESLTCPAPWPLQDNKRMHEWISAAHSLLPGMRLPSPITLKNCTSWTVPTPAVARGGSPVQVNVIGKKWKINIAWNSSTGVFSKHIEGSSLWCFILNKIKKYILLTRFSHSVLQHSQWKLNQIRA